MRKISVLLVDPHPVFRQGLHLLFSREPDLRVVGEATDSTNAALLARELQPDIVLTELPPPDGPGLALRQAELTTQVIILTAQHDVTTALRVLKQGARSYLTKDAPPEEILRAVRHVAAGGVVLDPLVAAHVLQEFQHLWEAPASYALPHLSAREAQILELVAQGYSNREIGTRLNLAEKTVRNALRRLFQKYAFTTRAQAAVFAVQEGLFRPPPGAGYEVDGGLNVPPPPNHLTFGSGL